VWIEKAIRAMAPLFFLASQRFAPASARQDRLDRAKFDKFVEDQEAWGVTGFLRTRRFVVYWQ